MIEMVHGLEIVIIYACSITWYRGNAEKEKGFTTHWFYYVSATKFG